MIRFRSIYMLNLFLLLGTMLISCDSALLDPETETGFQQPVRTDVPDSLTGAVAFVHVNVVPMHDEIVLEDQTVLIKEGVIQTIGKADDVQIPESYAQIEARDAFLMPGLIDMHVHLTSIGPQDLLLFPAYGVTTVRSMWGHPSVLTMRQSVAAEEIIGPTIFTASPGLEGTASYWPGARVVTSREEVSAALADFKAAGYDFLKTYNTLSAEIYNIIFEEAEQHNFRVVGHLPSTVSLDQALTNRHASIAHLIGYSTYTTTSGARFWNAPVNEDRIAQAARETAAAGTWNCPTLTVLSRTGEQIESLKQSKAWAYLSDGARNVYDDPRTQPPGSRSPQSIQNQQRMVLGLHEANAGLLLGSDTGVQYVLPGLAAHEELTHLVSAGLSPYAALYAGTVAASNFLGDNAGAIAEGRRADLILLERNPLLDVTHAAQRIGVMIRGTWYSTGRLEQLLEN